MCHVLAAGIGIADQKHVCSMLESRGRLIKALLCLVEGYSQVLGLGGGHILFKLSPVTITR